ncbi:FAD:protein FMN transferase [Algiphilus sp.]|uniref:FAD:protein FMN transferase n=1 Tax=Algiphilus sp. TaxID=1872431 RepID=UPI0025C48648|nr:FAD:protein FMN transferase [Algiphilus sp.]MCK5769816.1 FAD:protein FMN transferase [Algiphilus sp.]
MELFRQRFTAMASPCELRCYADEATAAQGALDAAEAEVRRIETKYSRYREDSIVSRINAAAGSGNAIAVDDETAALLDYSATVFEQSDGRFDITSGVLRRAWDFRRQRVPAQSEVDALLPLIGWQRVEWASPHIHLSRAGMQLDFGGFGKEYAVDRAVAVLEAHGIAHGMVDLGGDVRVVGPHPDGSAWRVGVSHPQQPDTAIARVDLRTGAIATSGDYHRAFIVDGRRYSHLLDARTGWPVADTFASASALAPRCLIAGSASTIAMLHGPDAAEWLRALGLPWLTVRHDLSLAGNAVAQAA